MEKEIRAQRGMCERFDVKYISLKQFKIITILEHLQKVSSYGEQNTKMWKTTTKVLTEYQEVDFTTEGCDCKCGERDCKRWVWNCQVTYDKTNGILKAQRSRCNGGSKVLNSISNAEVTPTSFPSCLSVHRVFWNMQWDICGLFLIVSFL
jgi:hypothetical protein